MSIQAVVFDIGNVLVEWHPEKLYDAVIGSNKREKLFAEVDLDHMNELVDLGHPFKETIYKVADENPKWGDEIRMWHDRWIDMCSPAIDHSVQLLRALKTKGVPVYSLSNFGVGSFEFAQTKYPFLKDFDQQYISGQLQLIKPDPAIYETLESGCGLPPGSLLFADDRANNIEAAQKRGWQTYLFETPQGWADCLVSHGVLSVEEALLNG